MLISLIDLESFVGNDSKYMNRKWLNKIFFANSLDFMKKMPSNIADLIFVDPPYNLQLKDTLLRPDQSTVEAVNEDWDKFHDYEEYDKFTKEWLIQCKRILNTNGSLWVIGSYHNILRVGTLIQNLGMWILNDIIWHKTNPMPNFRGTRFTNAHETLLWCTSSRKSKYTFNYNNMKQFNEDKQMRSDWYIPICSGNERIKNKKNMRAHPTQKPEALLYRILLSSSNPKDVVFDPFIGSGTSAVAAKKLGRKYIGIENNKDYYKLAKSRLKNTSILDHEIINVTKSKKQLPKVAFGELVEQGIIPPGTILSNAKNTIKAKVKADGSIETSNFNGSIHQTGAFVQGLPACNGWDYWHLNKKNNMLLIDELRKIYRLKNKLS